MRYTKFVMFAALSLALYSCQPSDPDNRGSSTPIDSTNLNGTAPATYGADNPANEQDTTYENATDTGTKMSNGPDRLAHPN